MKVRELKDAILDFELNDLPKILLKYLVYYPIRLFCWLSWLYFISLTILAFLIIQENVDVIFKLVVGCLLPSLLIPLAFFIRNKLSEHFDEE